MMWSCNIGVDRTIIQPVIYYVVISGISIDGREKGILGTGKEHDHLVF